VAVVGSGDGGNEFEHDLTLEAFFNELGNNYVNFKCMLSLCMFQSG
jgi:hypothetical protein